jgi:hypothetical protein
MKGTPEHAKVSVPVKLGPAETEAVVVPAIVGVPCAVDVPVPGCGVLAALSVMCICVKSNQEKIKRKFTAQFHFETELCKNGGAAYVNGC